MVTHAEGNEPEDQSEDGPIMGHWYDDIPIVAAKRRGVLPQKEKVTKHAKKQ